MTTVKPTDKPADESTNKVVPESSALITVKRKYFYPASGKTLTRKASVPAIKTKDATNEETK